MGGSSTQVGKGKDGKAGVVSKRFGKSINKMMDKSGLTGKDRKQFKTNIIRSVGAVKKHAKWLNMGGQSAEQFVAANATRAGTINLNKRRNQRKMDRELTPSQRQTAYNALGRGGGSHQTRRHSTKERGAARSNKKK